MRLLRVDEFNKEVQPWKTFYVGFLKGKNGTWFPFCMLSSNGKEKLDTLCVSTNYSALEELVKPCVEQVTSIDEYLIHFVYGEEIKNLVERYSLEYIGYIENEEGCSCGCGCG